MNLAEAVKTLRADLEFPGEKRKEGSRPLPRVLHSVALWNLALRMLDPTSAVTPEDKAVRANLDQLVTNIFRRPLDEISALRKQGIDPLLTFARAHKIDQYVWEPPTLRDGTVSAKLAIVVQTPVQEIHAALDPVQWTKKCGLFWREITLVDRPDRQRVGPTLRATLNLPGPAAARAVRVEVSPFDLPLGFGRAFQIFDAGVAQDPPLLCAGSLTAEKEEGNPWATRIMHEKQIRAESLTLGANVEDTLRFWIQAETVCLALPQ
ncbi:MAG: hypothetical protein ACRERC_20360 [Candidatus Binatia bacterium]